MAKMSYLSMATFVGGVDGVCMPRVSGGICVATSKLAAAKTGCAHPRSCSGGGGGGERVYRAVPLALGLAYVSAWTFAGHLLLSPKAHLAPETPQAGGIRLASYDKLPSACGSGASTGI